MAARRMMTAMAVVLVATTVCGCPDLEWVRLRVDVDPPEGGRVVVTPHSRYFLSGTEVVLKAVPWPGWRFDAWEGPVGNPSTPVTTLSMATSATVRARFVEAPEAGATRVSVTLDEPGDARETATVTTNQGTELLFPAGIGVSCPELGPLSGTFEVVVEDLSLHTLPSVSWTSWVWAFAVDVEVAGCSEGVVFSSLNNENVVLPDYAPSGVQVTIPVAGTGLDVGAEVTLYREGTEGGGWIPVGQGVVDDTGLATFDVMQAGRYGLGTYPRTTEQDLPVLGDGQLYDCTFESDEQIAAVKVIEPSTAEVFSAWVYTQFPPNEIPETTPWETHNGDEPCAARLENYGKRFRIRSAYANHFAATYALWKESVLMNGPFEVDGSGTPAPEPIPEPYDQCDRIFAGEVSVRVLARSGNYSSFRAEVMEPLRAAYGSDEVVLGWFRALKEGYYAEVRVRSEECARYVAQVTTMADEEEVELVVNGRLAMLVDRRNGVPYVAFYSVVAQGTGVGIKFVDPFWELTGGVVDDLYIGGPNHMLFPVLDLEYDHTTDALWVLHGNFTTDYVISRYDRPIVNHGDRAPDLTLSYQAPGLRRLYLDQLSDRLYAVDFAPSGPFGPSDVVRIWDNVSSDAPTQRTPVTNISFWSPITTDPQPMSLGNLGAVGNRLYLFSSRTQWQEGREFDGVQTLFYDVASGDGGASFQGWGAFGGPQTAPVLDGMYNQLYDTLFLPAVQSWNGLDAIYAVSSPTSWTSTWITPEEWPPYWEGVTASYRVIRWPNAGTVHDVDVLEASPAYMAVVQTQGDPNEPRVYVFGNAGSISGMVTPLYEIQLHNGTSVVELIDPPKEES